MKIDFSNIKLSKIYEKKTDSYSLSVWGQCWDSIPESITISYMSIDELQKLNFDGAYIAYYENLVTKDSVIFRGHEDSFSLFWFEKEGIIYFTDDYFSCLKYFDKLTWNLDSISDYFETSWNNICKYNRTPFKEINKLDAWECIIYQTEGKGKLCNWKKLDTKIVYTEKNLDTFKKDLFTAIDFYLKKIYEKTNGNIAISLSAGTDSNTLAARWCQLYPKSQARFFTSKINDITDESKIASFMQTYVTNPIKYISINTEANDFVDCLYNYMQTHLPPRFENELSENNFIKQLTENELPSIHLSGAGADGCFGFFGGEYHFLMNEYLTKFRLIRAKKIFNAIQISFYANKSSNIAFLWYLFKFYVKMILPKRNIEKGNKSISNSILPFIKVSLPIYESKNVKSYKDSILFAAQDGAERTTSNLYRDYHLEVYYPFMGYKLCEIGAKSDPYIFSIGENKYCLRYAIKDLLPKEILNNKVKLGNPGVTLEKLLHTGNNKESIITYLSKHESVLVDNKILLNDIKNDYFTKSDFLALCLLMFENIIRYEHKIKVTI